MSEFLPETGAGAPQTDSVGSLLTPATLDISSGDIALMQKVLSAAARNPNLIPSDFMAYLVDYIQTSRLSIPIGQVFGFTQSKTVSGSLDVNGVVTSGTGFTCTNPSTGVYVVTLNSAFTASPAVVATLTGASIGAITVTAVSPSSFTVNVRALSGALANGPFNFLAEPFV